MSEIDVATFKGRDQKEELELRTMILNMAVSAKDQLFTSLFQHGFIYLLVRNQDV